VSAEPSILDLDTYNSMHGRVELLLKSRGMQWALDTLGHEPTLMWEVHNPNNLPLWGPEIQRQRLFDHLRGVHGGARSDAVLGLAKFTSRAMVEYLAYQMRRRGEAAVERIRVERRMRFVADPHRRIVKATRELAVLIVRARQASDLTQPSYSREDPIRPPDDVMRGVVEALPKYLALFEPGQPLFFPPILGTKGEGTDDVLGKGSALGAFAVIIHALAQKRFREEDLNKMIAAVASATLGMEFNARAVRHRRDVFLKARGQPSLRRQLRAPRA
jgi:hypothetical protein